MEGEDSRDFIEWVGAEMSIKILMCLEDASDLVRLTSVSTSWRRFVIANGLSKQLCLKLFPEISRIAQVTEMTNMIEPVQVRPDSSMEWECLERDHRVYAYLAQGLTSFVIKDCVSEAISASSTDHYPEESIQNTLEPRDIVEHRASYWSSKGESDPAVPEMLVYKLIAKLCVIFEIHLKPFQDTLPAYFQFRFPIFSSETVRFRMGHPKYPVEIESDTRKQSGSGHESIDNEFVWTYTSPEFPVAQENRLQKFKLPKPVLCIGGILQIELLGRVQKHEMDDLYYICISHVQVVGRSLTPAFDVEVLDPSSGRCKLKYYPGSDQCCFSTTSPRERLLGSGAVVMGDDGDSDDKLLVA